MNDDQPLRVLAPDDSPAPGHPDDIAVDLMAVLREAIVDALSLRQSVVAGVPSGRSVVRAVEVHEAVARALDLAEAMRRACRYHHGTTTLLERPT